MPGLIRECLNYEVAWLRGYTRIDGWERFDGNVSPSSTTGWVFTVLKTDITGAPFVVGETLTWTNAGASGDAGIIVDIEDTVDDQLVPVFRFFQIFRTGRNRPVFGDIITGDESGASFLLDSIVGQAAQTFPDYFPDHQTYLSELDKYGDSLRAKVEPVPGGGTIVGLHYHEDSLYAIRDVNSISVQLGDVDKLGAGMYVYNLAGQVGEVLRADAIGNTFHIAAVDADGFALATGDTIHVALTARFTDGTGEIVKGTNVLGGTSGLAAEVGFIALRDGSFDSANALGVVALINLADSPPGQPGEIFTDVLDAGNTFVLDTVQFPANDNATTVLVKNSQAEIAAMWRSTDDGWVAADAGRTLKFENGTNDPTSDTPVPASKVAFPGLVEVGTTTDRADWSGSLDNIKVSNDQRISSALVGGGPFGAAGYSDSLKISDFKIGMRNEEVITGISMTFEGYTDDTSLGSVGSILVSPLEDAAGGRNLVMPRSPSGVDAVPDPETGGASTQWTNTPHTAAQVNASTFGFSFLSKISDTSGFVYVDSVKMTVFYTAVPGETLYIHDGVSDVGTISVRNVVIQEGAWDGTGTGYFRLKDWTVVDLPAGAKLYTQPNAAGLFVADIVGDVSTPVLPGSLQLDAKRSRYQIISYNFFATEDQNAIYGVNGAGPAFWYDGKTLDFILTGVGATDGSSGDPADGVAVVEDQPRHIAPHENRLALGYIWGEVYLSGPDPLDFSASTGLAASFGFGDKITGLMPAAGKALAVFTESSTSVLLGAPTAFGAEALASVNQQIINHKVGAIEYTVQSMGKRPIFASFRGIETLETMDEYSDFTTAPLTYNVSPWLLERLQTAAGLEAADKSVVNSVVVRNKNQYRLFFADGYVLTLTYVGPEKAPQNTIQQYWFASDRAKYSRCYATASGVTTDGRDRAFFSVERRPASPDPDSHVLGEELDYVYELDRGRSFDGGSIEASFTLTYYFAVDERGVPNAKQSKRFNTMQLHGVCAGTADLKVSRAVNYEDLDDPVLPFEPMPLYHGSMPPQDQPLPKYTKARLSAEGFALSVQVKHTSSVEFPHTVQMITFLNDSPRRLDR